MSDEHEKRAELRRLLAEAFRGPWVARTFEIDCPGEDCEAALNANEDVCGYTHELAEVSAPDEYPNGQVVADIVDGEVVKEVHTPGLGSFAKKNAALIAAMRNALPGLLDALDAKDADLRAAKAEGVRARVVAWLRGAADQVDRRGGRDLDTSVRVDHERAEAARKAAADRIERGEHVASAPAARACTHGDVQAGRQLDGMMLEVCVWCGAWRVHDIRVPGGDGWTRPSGPPEPARAGAGRGGGGTLKIPKVGDVVRFKLQYGTAPGLVLDRLREGRSRVADMREGEVRWTEVKDEDIAYINGRLTGNPGSDDH